MFFFSSSVFSGSEKNQVADYAENLDASKNVCIFFTNNTHRNEEETSAKHWAKEKDEEKNV